VTFSGKQGVPSLTAQLERLFDEPELVERYRARARERARRYSWDAVTDEYEQLLVSVHRTGVPASLPVELVDTESAQPLAGRR
jgi:hypothetical protein